jgi:hypothetical protein
MATSCATNDELETSVVFMALAILHKRCQFARHSLDFKLRTVERAV